MPQMLIKQGVIIFAAAATLEKKQLRCTLNHPQRTIKYHGRNNKNMEQFYLPVHGHHGP